MNSFYKGLCVAVSAVLLTACGAVAPNVYHAKYYHASAPRRIIIVFDTRADTGDLSHSELLLEQVAAQIVSALRGAGYDVVDSANVALPHTDAMVADRGAQIINGLSKHGFSHGLIAIVGATDRWADLQTGGTDYNMPVTCKLIDVGAHRGLVAETTINGYTRDLDFIDRQVSAHPLASHTDINGPERVYPEAISYACREVLDTTFKTRSSSAPPINQRQDADSYGHGFKGQDAYGYGRHSDVYGRPFDFRTDDGEQVFGPVKPNAYGLGVSMDQYGRPVYAQPAW